MKYLRPPILALMLGVTLPAYSILPAQAQLAVDISVEVAPPPLPYYEQPVIPAEGYIWVPGYWAWDPGIADYYWVPGTWVQPPQPELLWTPAYWGWEGGRYGFHPGYWGREVGFYGGIDYGFGYSGDGYHGGRWDHGAFFYNTTVNNITNVRITNVYNQTVVVNRAASRVSFNGGNGGIVARPTPQQEAFARERHVEATPVQRQHVETASKDRSLFSKQNHGEPAVAATARPGVMQGAGVTRASPTPVAAPNHEPNREPGQPVRPGQEAPRAVETGREAPKPVETPKTEQPRPGVTHELPKVEPKPEPRPEPKAEEHRPEQRPMQRPEERPMQPAERRPAPEAPRPPAEHAAPHPAPAPAPHPPAPHAPPHEEEKR